VLAAAAAIVVFATRGGDGGPDPYAGAYPVVSAAPSPSETITWAPTVPPAGPLPRFPGRPSRVAGTIVDREAGLSYARPGAPWRLIKGFGSHTAGVEYTIEKPKFRYYGTLGSNPMLAKFSPATVGPNRLRAAAELSAQQWSLEQSADGLTPIAGQPLKVSGRQAWLAGYRASFTDSYDGVKEQMHIVVAVDTGRRLPGMFDATVAQPKYILLPDINTLVRSLRVIR
jgi:hypothetical protein